MTNLFKFFVAVLMAMSIGIVSAAGWQQDNS